MKKNFFIFLLLGSILFPANAAKSKKNALKTPVDSVSYALGLEVGNDLKRNLDNLLGEPVQINLFLEGMKKALEADTTNLLIDKNQTKGFIQSYMQKAEEERNTKTLAENKLFLENNKKNKNVITTASGLQYEILKQGNGLKPNATDKVKVHYHGTLLDGTVFDSSIERGTPIEFELNKVIPGWTEGVQLMPIGSKYKFYIPSELAYGTRSMGKIKPNSVLIFEVELLGISEHATSQENNNTKFQFEPYQKSTNK